MVTAGLGKKCEGWLEKVRCTLPFKVQYRRKSDCCWAEVNLAALTCWGYYQILNIGVSHSVLQWLLYYFSYYLLKCHHFIFECVLLSRGGQLCHTS